MKTGVEMKVSDQGFNLTAICSDGSPITTQLWNGGLEAAAGQARDWLVSGNWGRQIERVYMTSHEHKETVEYARCHLTVLDRMAK